METLLIEDKIQKFFLKKSLRTHLLIPFNLKSYQRLVSFFKFCVHDKE